MKVLADKKLPNKSQAVANTIISQHKTNHKVPFQFVDNRPKTAKKYLNDHNNSPVQLVLKDQSKAALDAQLTSQYHADEDAGDAFSVNSRSISDHQSAIRKYQSAKSKRKRAGKLHVNQDGGHLTAISTLNDKISVRREKIQGLQQQKATEKKPKRPALKW